MHNISTVFILSNRYRPKITGMWKGKRLRRLIVLLEDALAVYLCLPTHMGNIALRKSNSKVGEVSRESAGVKLPNTELAFLPLDIQEGMVYFKDMMFALPCALENRHRMSAVFKETLYNAFSETEYIWQS